MSELSFLLELLLDHELPKPTKDRIAQRIREVEANLTQTPEDVQRLWHQPSTPVKYQQAPSTLALMAKHGDISVSPPPEMPPIPVIPVEHIAQTPAAAAAINSRNEAIAQALSGKVDKVTGRPRKW